TQRTAEGEQLLRVRQPSLLLLQRIILPQDRRHPLDLVDLEAQEVRALRRLCTHPAELLDPPAQVADFTMDPRNALQSHRVRRVGIENRALLVASQQSLVLVLAMEAHQRGTHPPQRPRRDGGAIDPRPVPPLQRHFPLQDEQPLVRLHSHLVEPVHEGRIRADLEQPLDTRSLRPGPHRIGGGALPQKQRQRPDDDRFARARLPGENVEPRAEAYRQFVDQREVANAKFREQCRVFWIPGEERRIVNRLDLGRIAADIQVRITLASPRSKKNPTMSVKAVTNTDEATAGSTPSRSSMIGTNA